MFLLGGLTEGIFECCSPASLGQPEHLIHDDRISARAQNNLFSSASGSLNLHFQKWQSDRHERVRAVVFVHHGEMEHGAWYNALAVRLAQVGCTTFAHDAQGWGQSDGARGYFESFEDLVCDYVEFCRTKWAEVLDGHSRSHQGHRPALVLLGKGFGALVVMRALVELQRSSFSDVHPSVVLISPAFQNSSFLGEETNVTCGLNAGQCHRQPIAQCARDGVAYAPACATPGQPWEGPSPCRTGSFNPVPEGTNPHQKLEQMSAWFPKMIVTQPVDPDMVSRDPQTVDRMNRDALCWRQGYRARVLAEIVHEQASAAENMQENAEVFEKTPALILHGSGDKLFDVRGSHGLHSLWCDIAQKSGVYPRLKIYDGAYHQLLNEPNKDEVMNEVVLFVASKSSA